MYIKLSFFDVFLFEKHSADVTLGLSLETIPHTSFD